MNESSFSSEAPLLIGSLTFIVQSLLKDLQSGRTANIPYYEKRIKELQESYPNAFFPELFENHKP